MRLKREVDELVKSKINQILTLHYDSNDDVISMSRDIKLNAPTDLLQRTRRGMKLFNLNHDFMY